MMNRFLCRGGVWGVLYLYSQVNTVQTECIYVCMREGYLQRLKYFDFQSLTWGSDLKMILIPDLKIWGLGDLECYMCSLKTTLHGKFEFLT